MRKAILTLAAAAALVYAGLLAFLWWKQEALIFLPAPLPADHRFQLTPDVHESTVPVEGATLSLLHMRLPAPKGVVFFLHGNAGNLQSWFTDTAFYREANFDLVMVDYRGFGKSTGAIANGPQLYADVWAAWLAVADRYRGKRVVLYGRSLGTGLAAELAQRMTAQGRVPDLTVLVSPYASMQELAGEIYPWVPTFLLRYPLPTGRDLAAAQGDVLILHGDADRLIPVDHARRLAQRVPRARLVEVPGATHDDIHVQPAAVEAFRAALARL